MLEAVEKLARVVKVPISAQPNAGLPREVDDRKIYMASPEYMASYARRIVEAGARLVGGCCGTTPDHIRVDVGFVQSVSPRHAFDMGDMTPEGRRRMEPMPLAERSASAASSPKGGSSPRSRSCRPRAWTRRRCSTGAQLKAAGVDAVNVPDGPGRRAAWARSSRR